MSSGNENPHFPLGSERSHLHPQPEVAMCPLADESAPNGKPGVQSCDLGVTAHAGEQCLSPKMKDLTSLFITLFFFYLANKDQKSPYVGLQGPPQFEFLRVQTSFSCEHFTWAQMPSRKLDFLLLSLCFASVALELSTPAFILISTH